MSHPAPEGSSEDRVQRDVEELPGDDRSAGRAVPQARVDERSASLDARPPSPVAPWAERLVRLLDDGIRIPGTELRFGLDGIIGLLFPGVGDMMTGAGSLSLLFLAIKHRVPTVVIARMVLNIGIDTLGGTVPILGDAFDFFFKSNRRNLDLIERYRDDPDATPSAADYLLVGAALLLVAVSVLLPILIVILLGTGLWTLLEG